MFKVGDLVIGTKDNPYTITNEHTVCIVTDIKMPPSEQPPRIEVAVYKDRPYTIEKDIAFPVEMSYFVLYRRKAKRNIEI
jgi:hypothetical protein